MLDTSPDTAESSQGVRYYDVSIADLLQSQLLTAGQSLHMFYGPRGGERKRYVGTILVDGSIETLGKSFSAPSYAALACIQSAGSGRETVNGWTSWRDDREQTLADLRTQFLQRQS